MRCCTTRRPPSSLSFVLPIAFALLGFAHRSRWPTGSTTSTTFNWVLNGEWSGHTPQILVAMVLWVAAPLAVGLVRTVRREIN